MTNFIEQKMQSRNMVLAGIAVVTLALVIGMKLFMSEDTAAVPARAADRPQLFKESAPSGLNPVPRSGSGSGLEMFSETNAGFYGEEKTTAAAAEQTVSEPAVVKSTRPAAVKAAVKAKPKGAVIPRLKPVSFDKISPTNVSPGGAGQGMPDVSDMLKRAQQGGTNKPPGN